MRNIIKTDSEKTQWVLRLKYEDLKISVKYPKWKVQLEIEHVSKDQDWSHIARNCHHTGSKVDGVYNIITSLEDIVTEKGCFKP